MKLRWKQRRNFVLAALILALGAHVQVAPTQAQSSGPVERQPDGAGKTPGLMEEWVRSLRQECQDEGRELQGLIVGMINATGDVKARPTEGEASNLKGDFALRLSEVGQIKEIFEKHASKIESFLGGTRCQETRSIAQRLLGDDLIEPTVRDLSRLMVLLKEAAVGAAGPCLSFAAQNWIVKTATPMEREKIEAFQKAFPGKLATYLHLKDWEGLKHEMDQALLVLDGIRESSLPFRELFRAEMRGNRGLAYLYRQKGDRADNIEKAVAILSEAVRTYDRAPPEGRKACELQRAMVQSNLRVAYSERIRGEHADNQELAIAAYAEALKILGREASSQEWATTQTNLGAAYLARSRHKRAANVDAGITSFKRALKVWNKSDFPAEWAVLQHNLGSAYSERIRGNRTENLKEAREAFANALSVRTREHPDGVKPRSPGPLDDALPLLKLLEVLQKPVVFSPNGRAMSLNGLGGVQLKSTGDKAENIENAIAAFEDALAILTREASSYQWALVSSNLGEAHASRIKGDRTANLDRAIAEYRKALTVRTHEAFPRDHLETATHLGQALSAKGDWRGALAVFDGARASFRLLFGQGLNEAEARDILQKAGPLFTEAAYAASELGDAWRALALLEEGRTRLLAVALRLDTLSRTGKDTGRLKDLRRQIREAERYYETAPAEEKAARIDKLSGLRAELAKLVDAAEAKSRAGAHGDVLSRVADLVPEGGALVAPIVAGPGSKLIVITRRGAEAHLAIEPVPDFSRADLDEILGARDGPGWLGAYSRDYGSDSVGEEWLGAIAKVGPQLGALLGRPLIGALSARGIPAGTGAPIVVLPVGALGLLPLGLAQHPDTEQYLGVDYTVALAPSLQVLASAGARPPVPPDRATLTLVANPTADLPFTEVEGLLIQSHFSRRDRRVVGSKAATEPIVLNALRAKHYWHFSSHGYFNWDDPRGSGLLLADRKTLAVGSLIETEGLRAPRLVVLSACESGLYDVAAAPNEFVGLPTAFLQLGARGVLATLWPVADLPTALLVSKFYELHLGNEAHPPAATLRIAQKWLRETSREGFLAYAAEAVAGRRLARKDLQRIEEEMGSLPSTPFSHPYHWGGFALTGL